jgi:replicative DNA helicase
MITTENVIISELLTNVDYLQRVIAHIRPEYFHDAAERVVLEEIIKYTIKYGNAPSKDALAINIDSRDDLNEQQYINVIDVLENLSEESHDNDWLIDATDQFIKDKSVYNAVMESISIIDDNEKPNTSLPDILSDALSVSLDDHVGHDYLDDIEERYDFYHNVEERIPCDLSRLNVAMKGGAPKKTLNCAMAGTNVGKTVFLCSLAASYLKQHKNVLYITMEMAEERIAERIDANILKTPMDELEHLDRDMYTTKFKNAMSNVKGNLIVKEYPTGAASAATFRGLLKELKIKKDFTPDILLIDYLAICSSTRYSGVSENSYHFVKAVAEELRGLAIECNVPIWTAAQTNRGAFNDSDPDMTSIAECIYVEEQVELVNGDFIAIKDVEIGDKILDNEMYKTVVTTHHVKPKDCVKITLKSGKTIIVSKQHVFPTKSGRKSIDLGLCVGDRLNTK